MTYREDSLNGIRSLYQTYSECRKCGLCEDRETVVFGAGAIGADLMFIGEAPTKEDDQFGSPFLHGKSMKYHGKAGEYLSNALDEAGVDRDLCYFTNMVLCRPYEVREGTRGPFKVNRTPLADELEACRDRLLEEIYLVDPKVIVLLGATAATLASRNKLQTISGNLYYMKVQGKTGQELRYPTIPTWHPLLLMRDNSRDAGSPAEQFFSHIKLAVSIAQVAKEYAGG